MAGSWTPLRVLLGHRGPQGHQGSPEPRANSDCLVLLESTERRVPKDRKETQEKPDQQDPKGKQEKWACQASRVPTAPRERRESLHLTSYRRAWPRS